MQDVVQQLIDKRAAAELVGRESWHTDCSRRQLSNGIDPSANRFALGNINRIS